MGSERCSRGVNWVIFTPLLVGVLVDLIHLASACHDSYLILREHLKKLNSAETK